MIPVSAPVPGTNFLFTKKESWTKKNGVSLFSKKLGKNSGGLLWIGGVFLCFVGWGALPPCPPVDVGRLMRFVGRGIRPLAAELPDGKVSPDSHAPYQKQRVRRKVRIFSGCLLRERCSGDGRFLLKREGRRPECIRTSHPA